MVEQYFTPREAVVESRAVLDQETGELTPVFVLREDDGRERVLVDEETDLPEDGVLLDACCGDDILEMFVSSDWTTDATLKATAHRQWKACRGDHRAWEAHAPGEAVAAYKEYEKSMRLTLVDDCLAEWGYRLPESILRFGCKDAVGRSGVRRRRSRRNSTRHHALMGTKHEGL